MSSKRLNDELIAAVLFLICSGADINACDMYGMNAVKWAAYGGIDLYKLLRSYSISTEETEDEGGLKRRTDSQQDLSGLKGWRSESGRVPSGSNLADFESDEEMG
eukprot:TRINITY_DN1945_c0_g1_i2.p1 TRINITY_DN1945_c0_g1~~TRINITY_DN1945_c0_g1_i2.p1  ORF type:complete len:105 (-),score=15.75 TRINITY_DN1945_c0_g1_i2:68-382(-)